MMERPRNARKKYHRIGTFLTDPGPEHSWCPYLASIGRVRPILKESSPAWVRFERGPTPTDPDRRSADTTGSRSIGHAPALSGPRFGRRPPHRSSAVVLGGFGGNRTLIRCVTDCLAHPCGIRRRS
jgi:hypothetical protein